MNSFEELEDHITDENYDEALAVGKKFSYDYFLFRQSNSTGIE
jgi:hypothetical protein